MWGTVPISTSDCSSSLYSKDCSQHPGTQFLGVGGCEQGATTGRGSLRCAGDMFRHSRYSTLNVVPNGFYLIHQLVSNICQITFKILWTSKDMTIKIITGIQRTHVCGCVRELSRTLTSISPSGVLAVIETMAWIHNQKWKPTHRALPLEEGWEAIFADSSFLLKTPSHALWEAALEG